LGQEIRYGRGCLNDLCLAGRLEEIVLGVDDLNVAFRDQDPDRLVGPAVDDDVVKAGPLQHVREDPSGAGVGDHTEDGLVIRHPGCLFRRAGHRADERTGSAPRGRNGRIVQRAGPQDNPVFRRERIFERSAFFKMLVDEAGLDAAAADVTAINGGVGVFNFDLAVGEVDPGPFAAISEEACPWIRHDDSL